MVEVISDNNKIIEVLDWAYEKSLDGIPGISSAEELAEEYLSENNGDAVKACDSLINWQIAKCATSGFLSGLGGIITLPVSIPANISSVIFIQMRMIAAIAYMGGHDIKDDSVRSLVYMCLTGNAAAGIAKEMGIKLGSKLAQSAIRKIPFEIIKKINQAVGFRLITKFGTKGIVNLGKAIPLVGGVISAGMDSMSTKTIGEVAKGAFLEGKFI